MPELNKDLIINQDSDQVLSNNMKDLTSSPQTPRKSPSITPPGIFCSTGSTLTDTSCGVDTGNDAAIMNSSRRSTTSRRGRVSIDEIHIQMLQLHESKLGLSQFSLCVNDSAAGKTFEESYEMGDVLGEGGFATVYRCKHNNNGHTYAVKEVAETEYACAGENILEEIDALKRLRDGPYVVRLLDVFREYECTYMVMEELKGGDLLARLEEMEEPEQGSEPCFSESNARKISRTLLEAIRFCHKKNIVHRDIKPENILFVSSNPDNMTIKLADFGCARQLTGENSLRTLCGTPQYVAPEIYTHTDGYDERCDLWSAGVVIYILLCGYEPFEGEMQDLPTIITEGNYKFYPKDWGHISQPPKDLISNLLVVDPNGRIKIDDALDCEWLKRRDKERISISEKDLGMNDSTASFDVWLKNYDLLLNGSSSRMSFSYPEPTTC